MPTVTASPSTEVGSVGFKQPSRVVVEAFNRPSGCHPAVWMGPFRPSCHSLGALRAQLRQGSQPREAVGGHRQRQKLVDLIQSSHHHLADRPDQLAPAEALLDALSLALADLVARVPRCAAIDGTSAVALAVLRHMRRDVDLAARLDEALGVVRLVRTDRYSLAGCCGVDQHLRSNAALGRAVGRAGLYVDHQAMSVVGEHMAQVAGQRGRRVALAVQLRFGVGLGRMRVVAARLAAPVLGRVPLVGAVLAPQALVAGPGLDERAVDAEVLAREQPALVGHLHGGVEQLGDRVMLDEAVSVLAEDRVVPHGVFDGQADEPAKQQFVLDLLDELPLAAHAVEHLQQHGPHELLWRDARAATLDVGLVHGGELGIHLGQRVVEPGAYRAQGMVGRDKVLQPHRGEQAFVVAVGSSHRRPTPWQSTSRCSLMRAAVSIGISTV